MDREGCKGSLMLATQSLFPSCRWIRFSSWFDCYVNSVLLVEVLSVIFCNIYVSLPIRSGVRLGLGCIKSDECFLVHPLFVLYDVFTLLQGVFLFFEFLYSRYGLHIFLFMSLVLNVFCS